MTRRTVIPFVAVVGIAWLVQSVVSPSASLPYVWPWSLVSAYGWGVVAIVGACGWWRGARMGPLLDGGLWLLAAGSVVSAALSDAPGVSGPRGGGSSRSWGGRRCCEVLPLRPA
jgi:hypothetical protein